MFMQELLNLRQEVSSLRRDKDELGKSTPIINMADSLADYHSKIRQLEEVLIIDNLGNRRWLHLERKAAQRIRDRQEFIRVRQRGVE